MRRVSEKPTTAPHLEQEGVEVDGDDLRRADGAQVHGVDQPAAAEVPPGLRSACQVTPRGGRLCGVHARHGLDVLPARNCTRPVIVQIRKSEDVDILPAHTQVLRQDRCRLGARIIEGSGSVTAGCMRC